MRPAYRFIPPAGLGEKKRQKEKKRERTEEKKKGAGREMVLNRGNYSLLEMHLLYTAACDSPLENIHKDITSNQPQQMPHATASRG